MRLQLALDAAEHFALLPVLASYFDIVEVGTPLLKRFGVAAITTARELTNGRPILADTKTVDGGGLEAELVFGAGAQWMTVLANAPPPTRHRAVEVALAHGCDVIFDTILDADPAAVTIDGTGPPPAGGSHCTHRSTPAAPLSTTAPTLPGWPPTEPRDIASRLLAASGRATSRPRSRPHQTSP
jgi:3-hexulose-6-phosphate synthase